MPHFESAPLSSRDFYDKAKVKVESILPDIDPALRIEIEQVTVTPSSPKRPYSTLALRFTSSSHPEVTWTMELEETDDYIEHRLEPAIRKIYSEHFHLHRE
jgi:hypothetical protein